MPKSLFQFEIYVLGPINVTPKFGKSHQIVSHSFKINGSTHNLITDVVSALNLATNL